MGSLRKGRAGVGGAGAAGSDPVTGRVIQRSVTFHGTAVEAEQYRAERAAEYAVRRAATRAAPMLTVGELLERWLAADHPWSPTTWDGYRSNSRSLAADCELARTRAVSLTPGQLRTAFARWSAGGATQSVIAARGTERWPARGSGASVRRGSSAVCCLPSGEFLPGLYHMYVVR